MSKHDFQTHEFLARRERVRAAMQAAGIDWLLAVHPVSIHWLTGSDAKSYQEFQCLFFPAEPGPVRVLAREGERNEFEQDALVDEVWTWGGGISEDPVAAFAKAADELGLRQARVGLEVPGYYLHPRDYVRLRDFLGKALVAEPTTLIADLKMVKSAAELSYIREAARLADEAMETLAGGIREGRSELELAGDVVGKLLRSGSGLAASPINLVTGDRTCFSHGAPTGRRLRRGDFGNVEFGAAFRRYTATIGRQFCLGEPTPRMRELHGIVREASDALIAEVRAGVPAEVPHQAACRVIAGAGLERGRVHLSGYGLSPGFPPSWAEPVHLLAGSRYDLQAGMVITVEPPVFLGDERLGARIIDNLLVTETGFELLSRFSRELLIVP